MDNPLANHALDRLRDTDSWAAIAFLNDGGDTATILDAYDALLRHLYWEERDLAAVLAIGRAGIQVGLNAADPAILSKVKTLAANVASFLWPGWGEPDLIITKADVAAGFDAARLNVRLAHQLNKDDLALCRAYWQLAGYYLASGDRATAREHYETSASYADKAGHIDEQLLAQSFVALTLGRVDTLMGLMDELEKTEHGTMFVDQVNVAVGIFG